MTTPEELSTQNFCISVTLVSSLSLYPPIVLLRVTKGKVWKWILTLGSGLFCLFFLYRFVNRGHLWNQNLNVCSWNYSGDFVWLCQNVWNAHQNPLAERTESQRDQMWHQARAGFKVKQQRWTSISRSPHHALNLYFKKKNAHTSHCFCVKLSHHYSARITPLSSTHSPDGL